MHPVGHLTHIFPAMNMCSAEDSYYNRNMLLMITYR